MNIYWAHLTLKRCIAYLATAGSLWKLNSDVPDSSSSVDVILKPSGPLTSKKIFWFTSKIASKYSCNSFRALEKSPTINNDTLVPENAQDLSVVCVFTITGLESWIVTSTSDTNFDSLVLEVIFNSPVVVGLVDNEYKRAPLTPTPNAPILASISLHTFRDENNVPIRVGIDASSIPHPVSQTVIVYTSSFLSNFSSCRSIRTLMLCSSFLDEQKYSSVNNLKATAIYK